MSAYGGRGRKESDFIMHAQPSSTSGPSTPRATATHAAEPLSTAFERFAGVGALVTGISSVLYAVFFLLVSGTLHDYVPSLLLVVGGLLATGVLTAVYARVRSADPSFALWALGLGVLGQVGAAIHGMYGLASVIDHAPASGVGTTLPNPVDPAGFLAFGVVGLSTFVFSWLIVRSRALPRGLGFLGYVLAVLLVALFLGALFTNDTKSLFILVPGGLASLVATPAWNIWLGVTFLRRSA
jgi:hypothetical protein